MATFPRMVFSFSIPSLLRMTPDTVRLARPDMLLERNAAGDANWRFDDAAGHTGAAFGAIDVDKGIVRYRDCAAAGKRRCDAADRRYRARRSLKFAGKGTLRGDPFEIQGTSEGIAELRRVNAPYHLVLSARAGATSMTFDGTAIPASLENAEGSLHLKGPDLSQPLSDRAVAAAVDATVRSHGQPAAREQQWIFRGIKGTVGDSDLAGDFTVDVSSKRHSTTAELTSRKMNVQGSGRLHRPAAGRIVAHRDGPPSSSRKPASAR